MVNKAGQTVAKKQAKVETARIQAKAKANAAGQEPKQITTAEEWGAGSEGVELEVPSGKVALVRPVGMQAFLTEGLIPNSLREIAMESVTKKKAPQMAVADFKPEQLGEMFELFDSVTVYCVILPVVRPTPKWTLTHVAAGECESEDEGKRIPIGHPARKPGVLYVDMVDLEDKAYIFQFACGGTQDLASFRSQYHGGMELLPVGSDVEDDA